MDMIEICRDVYKEDVSREDTNHKLLSISTKSRKKMSMMIIKVRLG